MPFFSIITINRNNAEGLKRTFESIKMQSCTDFEYIIIDGASDDDSVDVINTFLKTEAGKKVSFWVSEKDFGIYNAINKGLSHVKGDYVNILNSGDCFSGDILTIIKKEMILDKSCVYYGAVSTYLGNKYSGVEGKSADSLTEYMIPHQAAFVPFELHKIYGFYNENYKISSDYDFFLKLYHKGVVFKYLRQLICDYDKSGISNQNVTVFKENLQIQKSYGYFQKKSLKSKLLVMINYFINVYIRKYL